MTEGAFLNQQESDEMTCDGACDGVSACEAAHWCEKNVHWHYVTEMGFYGFLIQLIRTLKLGYSWLEI